MLTFTEYKGDKAKYLQNMLFTMRRNTLLSRCNEKKNLEVYLLTMMLYLKLAAKVHWNEW